MIRRISTAVLAVAAICALTACAGGGGGGYSGGGGGGGGGGGPPPPFDGITGGNFTAWSAITPNTTITAVGPSRELPFTENLSTGAVSFGAASGQLTGTFQGVYDNNRQLTSISLIGSNRTMTFSVAAGDSLFGANAFGVPVVVSINDDTVHVGVDPFLKGWDYQSFGIWINETTVSSTGTGTLGAGSVGKTTGGASIPTTGAATFSGNVAANYVSTTADFDQGFGTVTLNADFGQRSVSFSSSDLTMIGSGIVQSGTAMTGTLTYSSQQNALSGTLSTVRLSGTANAQFYGPSAQEIGGAFTLTPTGGSGNERMIGGFGAKR